MILQALLLELLGNPDPLSFDTKRKALCKYLSIIK